MADEKLTQTETQASSGKISQTIQNAPPITTTTNQTGDTVSVSSRVRPERTSTRHTESTETPSQGTSTSNQVRTTTNDGASNTVGIEFVVKFQNRSPVNPSIFAALPPLTPPV